jgi:cytochrome c oxidase subunit 3
MAQDNKSAILNNTSEETPRDEQMIKARKLLLILGIVGIIMFFAGLTSMHIVSRAGASYWLNITMPNAFWLSTVFIVLSSVTMMLSVRAVKANNRPQLKIFLVLSLVLGLFFVNSQFVGWQEMSDKGMHLRGDFLSNLHGDYGVDYYLTDKDGLRIEYRDGHYYDPQDPMGNKMLDEEISTFRNPAARNLIALTALHALHVGGGLIWLIYLVIMSMLGKLSSINPLPVSQGAVYWHFVDLLWVYLLLFLYFIH